MKTQFELRRQVTIEKVILKGPLAYNNRDCIWQAIWLHLRGLQALATAQTLRCDLFPRLPERACLALLHELEAQGRLAQTTDAHGTGWQATPSELDELAADPNEFWRILPAGQALRLDVARVELPNRQMVLWPMPGTVEVVELDNPDNVSDAENFTECQLMNPAMTCPKLDPKQKQYTKTPEWQFCFMGPVEMMPSKLKKNEKQSNGTLELVLRERDGQMYLEDAAGNGCAYPWVQPLTERLQNLAPGFDSETGVLRVYLGPDDLWKPQPVADRLRDWVPELEDVYGGRQLPGKLDDWTLSLSFPRRLADRETAQWAYLDEFCQQLSAQTDPLAASQQWDALAARVAQHKAWKGQVNAITRQTAVQLLEQVRKRQPEAPPEVKPSYQNSYYHQFLSSRSPQPPSLPDHLHHALRVAHLAQDLVVPSNENQGTPQLFLEPQTCLAAASASVFLCVGQNSRWLEKLVVAQPQQLNRLRVYALFSYEGWQVWSRYRYTDADKIEQATRRWHVRVMDQEPQDELIEGLWTDGAQPQPGFVSAPIETLFGQEPKKVKPQGKDWNRMVKHFLLMAKPKTMR
jgi:hypothetical protein